MKLIWTHPTKGDITENLCNDHIEIVTKALNTLGIGFEGDDSMIGVCLRCAYGDTDIRTWMDQWD